MMKMNGFKRTLAFVLAAAMVFTTAPIKTYAEGNEAPVPELNTAYTEAQKNAFGDGYEWRSEEKVVVEAYDEVDVLTCEETSDHTHGDDCYVEQCNIPGHNKNDKTENSEHHNQNCVFNDVLVCDKHVHDASCRETIHHDAVKETVYYLVETQQQKYIDAKFYLKNLDNSYTGAGTATWAVSENFDTSKHVIAENADGVDVTELIGENAMPQAFAFENGYTYNGKSIKFVKACVESDGIHFDFMYNDVADYPVVKTNFYLRKADAARPQALVEDSDKNYITVAVGLEIALGTASIYEAEDASLVESKFTDATVAALNAKLTQDELKDLADQIGFTVDEDALKTQDLAINWYRVLTNHNPYHVDGEMTYVEKTPVVDNNNNTDGNDDIDDSDDEEDEEEVEDEEVPVTPAPPTTPDTPSAPAAPTTPATPVEPIIPEAPAVVTPPVAQAPVARPVAQPVAPVAPVVEEPQVQEIVEAPAPLAGAGEAEVEVATLEDDDTPLAAAEDGCIIHIIMLILTVIYGVYSIVRAFARKKENEDETEEVEA